MKWTAAALFALCLTAIPGCATPDRTSAGEGMNGLWRVDNLSCIAGCPTAVVGRPRVVDGPDGKCVEFDGAKDALIVEGHPLAGMKEFTVEVVFRPDVGGLEAQRFLHLQENGSDDRVLMETRLTGDGQWFLDTFIKAGDGSQALLSERNPHPVGLWYHAALVFDGSEMRQYVDGRRELSAPVRFTPPRAGQTSIGARLNHVSWFKGAIREIRFTPRALGPEEFLQL